MRYSRQIPVFGQRGQNAIKKATIGIAGLGGLGCNVMTQLACAGIGHFVIADDGISEESNLNRQFVHSLVPIGTKKTASSEKWIRSLSGASVESHDMRMDDLNSNVFKKCDIVADCTDNDRSRLILNRFAFKAGIPLIYGAAEAMYGQVSTIVPGRTPCLNCFLSGRADNGSSLDTAYRPSVGAAVSLIASVQAAEVLKTIAGTGETLAGKLFTADLNENAYRIIPISARDGCDVCNVLIR